MEDVSISRTKGAEIKRKKKRKDIKETDILNHRTGP